MRKLYLAFLFLSLKLFAQQDTYLSLIDYQMPLINPAHAGVEDQSFAFNSRNQWASIEQSPKTIAFTYSMARGKNVGLGVSVISDEVFIEKQTFLAVDFSYKLTLSNDSKIFLGLKAGMNSFRANTTNLTSYSQTVDPAKKDMSRLNPNIGVGLLLQNKTYWFSASIPRLFNAKRNEEIYLNARDRVHFYMAGGKTFIINENLNIEPRFIYRTSSGIKSIAEGMVWASYKTKFDFGIGIRTASVMSYKIKLDLSEMISISYAYDTFGGLNNVMNQLSAHEFGLKIRLNKKTIVENEVEQDQIDLTDDSLN